MSAKRTDHLEQLRRELLVLRTLPPPEDRRALRQASGVSLRRLARAVGVSATAVHAWERGERDPRGANLDRYLEALRVLEQAA